MSFLKQALELAEKGFYVFPLQVGGKLPAIKDFNYNDLATRDPKIIKKWWVDPVMEMEQPYNVGISTTRYNGNQALVVVDVDNKSDKNGSDELLKLELEGKDFGQTASQVTPTGGLHLIYRAKQPVKQGTDVLARGLDIRSKGGYIVAPGSIINGVPYKWKQGSQTLETCPEWIIEACGRAIEKETIENQTPIDVNPDRANARGKHYLLNEAPLAIEGEHGDQTTFKVAAKLKDFGVDSLSAINLMLEHWNDRCSPPWSVEEIKTKVNNAYNYGLNQVGTSSPEAVFDKVSEFNDKNYLHEMNKHYAVLFNEGECAILFETLDERGRPKREFMKESAFKRKFSPHVVQQGRGKALSYADVWLDWVNRREYMGLCFRPELEPQNNYYNLWRGFVYKQTSYQDATASARLGFDLFISHARENVCGGDEKLFLWLMGYFAHMIQKPYERPLTTLVFRGRKGVGKNALIERIGKLIGSTHFLVAHDSRYLTSNFNGHLDSCLMLVLDEAFWSGDKAAEGKLKGLTTAPEIMIERKGKEPYMVDNFVRLIVIGNESWLVPASADERRYAVFDVGEGKKQNREFFRQMRVLLDDKGGAEILMHYFKNFDLSKVDVNDAPHTAGLADQKEDSLSAIEGFWFQCLKEGKLINMPGKQEWELQVSKNDFRVAFTAYCKERGIRTWVPSENALSRELMKLTPTVTVNQKMKVDETYIRCYRFSSMEVLRAEWDRRMGYATEWD